jgi:DNA repair protein RecN (Recombination protein N)
MLLELNIKDFAIIDNLHLRLNRLFNVFTGETGAGKSILIDAVNALLGGKIGAEFVRAGCERATVEGVFSLEALPPLHQEWQPSESLAYAATTSTHALFEACEPGINYAPYSRTDANSPDARVALTSLLHEFAIKPEDGALILSRDIFRSGRTVARINGRVLPQHTLQQVASWLVDIHGQSEHMTLLRTEQHINFLDRYAELVSLREKLANKFNKWRNTRKTLQSLLQNEREQARRAELLRFEIEEIEQAELRVGELEELEEERQVLNNAEHLRTLCTLIYGSIKGSDLSGNDFTPALDQLFNAQRSLNELTRLDSSMKEYTEALAGAIYQLEDVAAAISSYEADIEDNPSRLEEIEERLNLIAKLKRKYGATMEEILQRAEVDRTELETIVHHAELVAKLQQQDGLFCRQIGALAAQLSTRRYEAARHLASAMEQQLNALNMKQARFQVEITQTRDLEGIPASINKRPEAYYACNQTGIDRVQFLIAPNPGEPFKPLSKIASGGETSRLMLALKSILAAADATPTLIFDEIDAGISGRSGQVVGEKLWQLTRNHQIICVTHLPQIAAFADTHYSVHKQIFENRTITLVSELHQEQRIREIAHIMGGTATEFSLKSAEELLTRSSLWKENWTHTLNKH